MKREQQDNKRWEHVGEGSVGIRRGRHHDRRRQARKAQSKLFEARRGWRDATPHAAIDNDAHCAFELLHPRS
jgi:hypothetical protein